MLQTPANLGEFLGGLAVIGGVIFAVVQVRQYREARRRERRAPTSSRRAVNEEEMKHFSSRSGFNWPGRVVLTVLRFAIGDSGSSDDVDTRAGFALT